MIQIVNPQDSLAIGRLQEFFSSNPPWNRSLWNIGAVLGLAELHEACLASRQGMLSEASVKRICSSLMRRCGKDPALSSQEKQFLRMHMNNAPRADGLAHHSIYTAYELLQQDYVQRWAGVLAKSPDYSAETFARSIAAHLLDAGFSEMYLHQFIKELIESDPLITLANLCEQLHGEIGRSPTRPFEVLLVYSKHPKIAGGTPVDWLDAKEVSQWLTGNNFKTNDLRASVGILLTVQARDIYGAAAGAREQSDRFSARARIATGDQLKQSPFLWVRGATEPIPLHAASRGVRVKALYLSGLTFAQSENKNIDAAIELLAHLDGSSPTAAIAGGWAAIEGLLADPSDRASAADNLASLVCCSLPRAELTALSFVIERQYEDVANLLKEQKGNRERSRLILRLINEGRFEDLPSASHRAAIMRMKGILANPSQELSAIKECVSEAFHRLYRQRNLILHGGKLDSVSLIPSLRTVAKLAGAGMDRITHGQYVQAFRPLELVARANLSIALIAPETAQSCVDLLETN